MKRNTIIELLVITAMLLGAGFIGYGYGLAKADITRTIYVDRIIYKDPPSVRLL